MLFLSEINKKYLKVFMPLLLFDYNAQFTQENKYCHINIMCLNSSYQNCFNFCKLLLIIKLDNVSCVHERSCKIYKIYQLLFFILLLFKSESIISEELKKASVALLKQVFYLRRYIIQCLSEYAVLKTNFQNLQRLHLHRLHLGLLFWSQRYREV